MRQRFSLRRPTASQERSGKKKRRPAPLEMTWSGRIGQNDRVAAAKIRMTRARPPRPTGVVVWTLRLHGGKVERQEGSEAKPPVRWGVC